MKNPMRSMGLAGLLLVVAGACHHLGTAGDDWRAPAIVRVHADSDAALAALFPTWIAWMSLAEAGQPQALLLRAGEHFFGSGNSPPVRYVAGDGPELEASFTNWHARINGTLVSLSLAQEEGRAWADAATDRQLADLRLLDLPEEIDPATHAALKRIAAVNPHVDLAFSSDAMLVAVLPLFRPRAVFLAENCSAQNLGALANQPELDTLMMAAEDAGSLDVLPTLPKLRRLFIEKWDVPEAGPLPPGLERLESLAVIEADQMRDLSALRNAPPRLESLSLLGLTNLTDIAHIQDMPGLRTLVLWGDSGIHDLSALDSNTRLQWVGLPPATSQEQFAAFVAAHPDLKILDLMGNEVVTNLAPLATLKSLEAVVLGDSRANPEVLQELTSLRFIGISTKMMENAPEQVAAIRQALPEALVVAVAPLCLGSGWLLPLAAGVALAWRFRQMRKRPARRVE